MVNADRLLGCFLDLVRIDGTSGRERAVAGWVQARLAALGLACHVDRAGEEFGGNCGNVIARLPGTVRAPTLLLCAHLDTVLSTAGLRLVINADQVATDESTILGADDRAGVAIILEVLEGLISARSAHGPIVVLFSVGEERGMQGTKAVDIEALRAAMGLVFDSSAPVGSVIIEAPAAISFRIVVRGRTAHAAVSPGTGIHAIQIAARAVAGLPLGRLGETGMMNVGTIEGGTAVNVVPGEVVVAGETRSADPVALDAQVALIASAFERAAAEAGGRVDIHWTRKYGGFRLGPAAPVVRAAMEGIQAAGCVPTSIAYPGGSDANILNERGIPTVNLGIGTQHVHSLQETMPIGSLVRSAEIGLAIVERAARGVQEGALTNSGPFTSTTDPVQENSL